MRALLVDDEAPARRRLARMLAVLPGVEVAGECEDGEQLAQQLATSGADVVFLDIQMPGPDGMALARSLPQLPPVVFVTAHDVYAVEAFDVEAVDYLMKPVTRERLSAAVERVRARLAQRPSSAPPAARITSTSGRGLEVFDPTEITRFHAAQKYTVYQVGGVEHLTEESLSQLQARLDGFGFMRVHRAELVQLGAVRRLHEIEGGVEVELSDGQRARVSRRCVSALRRALRTS